MAIVDDALILKLENFRTKVIRVLKEKGIEMSDDAPLNDEMVKKIDEISVQQGLEEYVSGDIEEYVNNEIRYVPAYTLSSRANLKKVRMDNLITIGGTSCFYANSSLKYFKADNLASLHNSFLSNSIVENVVLPNLITGGYLAISDIPCLRRLVVPKLQTGLNNTNLNSVELCDIGSNDRISDAYLKNVKIFITRKKGTILALPSATKHILNPEEIYVPQDLIEQYKVATNWATYADKFKPLEGSKYEPLNWYEEEAWYKEEMKVWE